MCMQLQVLPFRGPISIQGNEDEGITGRSVHTTQQLSASPILEMSLSQGVTPCKDAKENEIPTPRQEDVVM